MRGSLLHGWRAVNLGRPGPIRRSNLDLSGSLESVQRQRDCFERADVFVWNLMDRTWPLPAV